MGSEMCIRDRWDDCVLTWLRHVLQLPVEALDDQSFAIICHVGVARGGLGIKLLNQLRGITADKLYWDCTNNLSITCDAMRQRGHISQHLVNALLQHRRSHQLTPGMQWTVAPPLMDKPDWLETLYPDGEEQGASVSNTILDKNLLKCLLHLSLIHI